MDTLLDLIDRYDIISFDIFETLIFRNVKDPTDIYTIVSDIYNDKNDRKIDFKRIRKNAEDIARKTCQFREVNIDEIYSVIKKQLGADVAKELENLEINVTTNLCVVNPEVYKYYQYCINKGKTIFIISDMFLPGTILQKILEKEGISGYKSLYSSCDSRKTKWENGSLFKFITDGNHLDPHSILHIGNDATADVKMAKRQGWNAFLYKDNRKEPLYSSSYLINHNDRVYYNSILEFIKNSDLTNKDHNFAIGFQVFGPLLYGYLTWIEEKAEQEGIDKILFMSRDGYILNKGFQYLHSDVESLYFYGSRRAFIVPLLHNDKNFQEMLSHYRSWSHSTTLKELMKRLGLDVSDYDCFLKELHLSENIKFNSRKLISNTKLLNLFDIMKNDIYKESVSQDQMLLKYLDNENISGEIGISDIGAACTIEYAFREYISHHNLNINLKGLYLSTSEPIGKMRACFINPRDREVKSLFRFCYLFLEVFLSAPHGTVLGYREKDGTIVPRYGHYEYELLHKDQEMIRNLQEGALHFVKKFSCEYSDFRKPNYRVALANFYAFGLYPNRNDVKIWGDFHFDSDEFKCMANPLPLSQYMVHPRQFLIDLKECFWLSGFLTRFFHSHLPMKFLYFLINYVKK